MNRRIISTFDVGDMLVRYVQEDSTGRVGLELIPTSMTHELATRREGLAGLAYIDAMPGAGDPPARRVDPLVHIKIIGDSYPGAFAQGRTLRDSPSVDRFKFLKQDIDRSASQPVVTTTLGSDEGIILIHTLRWHAGDSVVQVSTTCENRSSAAISLELLTSFSLGGITPFDAADAPGRLRVHRFRSGWSAEGRLTTESIEQLNIERSWSGAGLFSERFGQIGTMPVRGWFPFVAVEDTIAQATWGAQVAWAGSWQMEIARQHDEVCISGGLADREFGHWIKTLAPGESITSPSATIGCVQGGLDELCDRLTGFQNHAADQQPAVERDLPIVFNEWCTTWGDPRHERVVAIADRLRGSEVKYLVIDAGWYKGDGGDWGTAHGDWVPNPAMFPTGLAGVASAIRERGLIPGLWFEMETVGDTSVAFSLADHLLKRDSILITVRNRRFWDLNDPFAVEYLATRAIGTLRDCGFGYLKVDYNETAGLGCDGVESQGEGLRRHVEGIYRFFDRIRRELPDLVIENCSSGGHRLEPSMLARTAMSSFSDAHELVEIPIIAANLHRLMLPRQSQIWAVLHGSDSDRRLVYSLAATFLGRMCLSGDIDGLSPAQLGIVQSAQTLYRIAAPIIRDGVSRRFGEMGESWRHPTGWQAMVRRSVDGSRLMIVAHTFAGAPKQIVLPLSSAPGDVTGIFGDGVKIDSGRLIWDNPGDFAGAVALADTQRR
ncbi:MAG: alpha-galactosidase [Burkholderiales bacterium]|nr:alpha-galactosidase [Phycisphaerae bacterium]